MLRVRSRALIALAPHGPAPRSVPQVPLCPLPPVPGHALVSSRCCLLAALAETRPWAPLVSKGPGDPVVARWPGPRRLPRACLRVPACVADGRQLRPPRSRRGHLAAFPRSPGSEPVSPARAWMSRVTLRAVLCYRCRALAAWGPGAAPQGCAGASLSPLSAGPGRRLTMPRRALGQSRTGQGWSSPCPGPVAPSSPQWPRGLLDGGSPSLLGGGLLFVSPRWGVRAEI